MSDDFVSFDDAAREREAIYRAMLQACADELEQKRTVSLSAAQVLYDKWKPTKHFFCGSLLLRVRDAA